MVTILSLLLVSVGFQLFRTQWLGKDRPEDRVPMPQLASFQLFRTQWLGKELQAK